MVVIAQPWPLVTCRVAPETALCGGEWNRIWDTSEVINVAIPNESQLNSLYGKESLLGQAHSGDHREWRRGRQF